MSETADPHHVSQVARHGLGPHVVGQRVVVRRVVRGVTGPTGGPALTDLLGVCLSWADGVCVVQPEDGPAVAIALTDIVSGKPVPPRPSTRLRVSAAEAQRRADALIRDLHTEPLDGWLLRHSPTSAAPRANSVLAFGPCGIDDAPERVTAFYAERTRRPLAAVLPGTAEEALLRARGWTRGRRADTLFQLAGVARALRLLRGHPAGAAECEYDGEGDRVTVRIGDRSESVV